MNPLKLIIVSIISGSIGGYLSFSFTPIPAQIGIIDLKALVEKEAVLNEDQAKVLTSKVKKVTESLVNKGVIIIDSQSVINAPEGAYINIDEQE